MLTPEQRREQLRALADARRAAREAAAARISAAREAKQQRGEVRSQEARLIEEKRQGMHSSKATAAGSMQRSQKAVAQNRKQLQRAHAEYRKRAQEEGIKPNVTFGKTTKVSGRSDGMMGASATLADPNANRRDARSEIEKQGGASLVDPNQGRDVEVNRGGSMVDGPAAGDARRYGRDAEGRAMNKREFDRVERLRAEARALASKQDRTAWEERRLEEIRAEVEGVTRPGDQRREVLPDPAQVQGQAEPQRVAAGGAVGGALPAAQTERERAQEQAEREESLPQTATEPEVDKGVYQRQFGVVVKVGEEGDVFQKRFGIVEKVGQEGDVFQMRFGRAERVGKEGDVFQMRFGRAEKVGQEGDVFQRRLGRIEKVGSETDFFVRQLGGWVRAQDARPPITRLRTVTRTNEILASARVAARRGRLARGVVIP